MELLQQHNVEFDVIEYLKQPLTRADFERCVDLLPDPPADLVRKDKRFAELGLRADDYITRQAVVDLLLQHPVLMQRPVVMRGNRAVIARPPEKVLPLIE